jgi:hypothetical protein
MNLETVIKTDEDLTRAKECLLYLSNGIDKFQNIVNSITTKEQIVKLSSKFSIKLHHRVVRAVLEK